MKGPALPHAKIVAIVPRAPTRRQKPEKISSCSKPRNPLKSLEFGRENPRKSKEIQPSWSGVLAAKRPRAKKTQTGQPDQSRGQLLRRRQTDSIQMQSGLATGEPTPHCANSMLRAKLIPSGRAAGKHLVAQRARRQLPTVQSQGKDGRAALASKPTPTPSAQSKLFEDHRGGRMQGRRQTLRDHVFRPQSGERRMEATQFGDVRQDRLCERGDDMVVS